MWWYRCVTAAPGRLRQEDGKFEANLGYEVEDLIMKTEEKEKEKSKLTSVQRRNGRKQSSDSAPKG